MQVIPLSSYMQQGGLRGAPAPRIAIRQKLALTTSEGMHLIHWSDIIHCIAESNYCRIALKGGRTLLVSKTLKTVESILPQSRFFRIHQSHVVSMDEISILRHDEILLTNGERLPVSRSRRADLVLKIQESATCV